MRVHVLLVALTLPAVAFAHGTETLHAREMLTGWTWDPWLFVPVALSVALYARGVRRLWSTAGQGHGVRAWEAGCYAAGVGSLVLALASPLDRLSDLYFSAHMSQHEVLMLVSAPLVALGRPLVPYFWGLPDGARERVRRWVRAPATRVAWRFVTHPFVAAAMHALALWLWHVPSLFEAALANERVHGAQHAMFFATAVVFWWALARGRYGRAGYGVAVLYVFATATHSGLLGALLTVAGSLWYPTHARRTSAHGVDPLDDQQLAGLIMWIPAGALLTTFALGLFAAWLGESERRARRRDP